MPLTRDFKETIQARAKRDPGFRKALLREGIENFLAGDLETGKIILRDFINATVGFPKLSDVTHRSAKSLMRMLSPRGNPQPATCSKSSPISSKPKASASRSAPRTPPAARNRKPQNAQHHPKAAGSAQVLCSLGRRVKLRETQEAFAFALALHLPGKGAGLTFVAVEVDPLEEIPLIPASIRIARHSKGNSPASNH